MISSLQIIYKKCEGRWCRRDGDLEECDDDAVVAVGATNLVNLSVSFTSTGTASSTGFCLTSFDTDLAFFVAFLAAGME